MIKLNI